jgi:hypothetical protein
MNKRIIPAIVGFAIMVVLTPFVFAKLMNSKFDSMITKVQLNGYKVKQIKNKSSYLTTDRVFDVIIPGSKIDSSGFIKYIEVKVETIFKNLPVTNVIFKGKVLKVVTTNPNLNENLNKLIKNKIKFVVLTPDFKTYTFRVFDFNINNNQTEITFKGIKGVFKTPADLNYKISSITVKNPQTTLEFKNIHNRYVKTDKKISQQEKFDFKGIFANKVISLKNVVINNNTIFGNKIDVNGNLKFTDLDVFNIFSLKNANVNLTVEGIDKKLFETLLKSPKNKREEIAYKILEKGFDSKINTDIKEIVLKGKSIGFLKINGYIDFKPVKNFQKAVMSKNFDFIDADIKIQTTPAVCLILMGVEPKMSFVLMGAQNKNGIVSVEFKLKNGALYINGQKVKSY